MKNIAYIFIFSFLIVFNVNSQTLSLEKTIKVKSMESEEELYCWNRINCKTKSIIPMVPEYGEIVDYLYFLQIDTLLNVSILKCKSKNEKEPYGMFYIDNGLVYPDNFFIFNNQTHFYSGYLSDNEFKIKNKINFSTDYNSCYDEMLFLDYPNRKYILLSNIYNNPTENQMYAELKLAKYNLKKQKVEKTKSINVGKGIFLSYCSFQWVASSKNTIAVADPAKPIIYLLDNDLNMSDTILINYQNIYKTSKLLDSILTDEIITKTKHNPKKIIDLFIENNIIKAPKIEKISFINNNLLLIVVQPEKQLENEKILFVYSLIEKQFLNKEGVISSYSEINSSEPLNFVKNITFNISDSLTENETFQYYITASKIEINISDNQIKNVSDKQKLQELVLKLKNGRYQKNRNAVGYNDISLSLENGCCTLKCKGNGWSTISDELKNFSICDIPLLHILDVVNKKIFNYLEEGKNNEKFSLQIDSCNLMVNYKNAVFLYDGAKKQKNIKGIEYELTIKEIETNILQYEIGNIDVNQFPNITNLEYYKPTDSIKNYSEFEYIMFSDIMACSHCRYDEKYKNILIIHCFSANEATDKTTKYRLLQMYQKMFVSPKVVFIKEKNLKNKFVKHKIFKIKGSR